MHRVPNQVPYLVCRSCIPRPFEKETIVDPGVSGRGDPDVSGKGPLGAAARADYYL